MSAIDDKSRVPILKSLEQREVNLVRALLKEPELLDARGELAVRTALSLSRLYRVQGPGGEVDVEEAVEGLRDETLKLLEVAGLKDKPNGSPSPEKLRPVATILRERALRTQELLYARHGAQLPRDTLDREVRTKCLVVAAGGGGGSGYVYLGAFKLLEECGLRPSLIAGTSMGAILGLFRARKARWETADILNVVRSLSWGKLFRVLSMESRYGLPAALRLYLRASIGKFFEADDDARFPICNTTVPLIAVASGIRAGVLPRPLEYYEGLLSDVRLVNPLTLGRKIPAVATALIELFQISERFDPVCFGLDEGTRELDAVDAIGFSSALPGVIHYDIVRDDDRMHEVLATLFAKRDLFRLADGCLVENVPAKAAWTAVHKGLVGTRNAFVLAMDCFAPKLTTPAWLAMQTIVLNQVQRSAEYAHLYKAFKSPPSPLELTPSVNSVIKILERGKEDLASDLPFIQRMMRPLAALE